MPFSYQTKWIVYNKNMKLISRSRKASYHWEKIGMTWEIYDELLEKQDGRCAICKRTPQEACRTLAPEYQRLVPDHSHKSGKIRGLLCPYCNSRVGFVEAHLRGIIDYLKQYR